jgi:hypothetical protein
MADKVYLDEQGNPISGKVYLDDNGEPIGAKPTGRIESMKTGVKEGWGDLKDMASALAHPIDTAKAMGGQMLEAARAVPDVVRNLANPETRGATASGFTEGAVEGTTGLTVDEAKKDPWRAGARFATNTVAPALVLKGAKVPIRMIKGARRAAAQAAKLTAVAPAERAGVAAVARGLGGDVPDEVVARGLAEGKRAPAGSRVVNPTVEIV